VERTRKGECYTRIRVREGYPKPIGVTGSLLAGGKRISGEKVSEETKAGGTPLTESRTWKSFPAKLLRDVSPKGQLVVNQATWAKVSSKQREESVRRSEKAQRILQTRESLDIYGKRQVVTNKKSAEKWRKDEDRAEMGKGWTHQGRVVGGSWQSRSTGFWGETTNSTRVPGNTWS